MMAYVHRLITVRILGLWIPDMICRSDEVTLCRRQLLLLLCVQDVNNSFLQARMQVLRLFWCPMIYLIYIYIYLSALGRHHAVYTHCIGRMHTLATTSGPAHKVGVVSIIKIADLEQTLLNLSSSKIRSNNLVKRSLRWL